MIAHIKKKTKKQTLNWNMGKPYLYPKSALNQNISLNRNRDTNIEKKFMDTKKERGAWEELGL